MEFHFTINKQIHKANMFSGVFIRLKWLAKKGYNMIGWASDQILVGTFT